MFRDCLWCFVCCDQLRERSGVMNKLNHKVTNFSYYIFLDLAGNAGKESVVLGLRASSMMHCSLASNLALGQGRVVQSWVQRTQG